MAEATIKTEVYIRVTLALPEVGLLCDALNNPPCDDESADHKAKREHLYTVLATALKKAYSSS